VRVFSLTPSPSPKAGEKRYLGCKRHAPALKREVYTLIKIIKSYIENIDINS
jgi:hypothetical protein